MQHWDNLSSLLSDVCCKTSRLRLTDGCEEYVVGVSIITFDLTNVPSSSLQCRIDY